MEYYSKAYLQTIRMKYIGLCPRERHAEPFSPRLPTKVAKLSFQNMHNVLKRINK